MAGVRKEQDDQELQESVTKNVIAGKRKKIDVKDPRFVPPDGGWGWIIVIAAGFSNYCTLTLIQSFGLLFMDKLPLLGFTSQEITTLTSSNCATTAFSGLANGPLFRKFTFREVALMGALLCTFSTIMLSFARTFPEYLAYFSIVYGLGIGLTHSSTSLALNTYFKEKRRIAVGLSWTCAGMAPIIMPQVVTALLPIYGQDGTVLIFGGFAFHAVATACLLRPVSLNVRTKRKIEETEIEQREQLLQDKKHESNHSLSTETKLIETIAQQSKSVNLTQHGGVQFGSQYLYYDDKDEGACGIDVIEGTPMMSRANDGWSAMKTNSTTHLATNRFSTEDNEMRLRRYSSISGGRPSLQHLFQKASLQDVNIMNKMKSNESKDLLEIHPEGINGYKKREDKPLTSTDKNAIKKKNCLKRWSEKNLKFLVEIFDLELMKDPIYVNMMIGITLANFVELNFALLTPFILRDYEFSRNQIAAFMSILGSTDVLTRICIPFVANYIGWENRSFFLIGVCSMAFGRIVLAHTRNYVLALAIATLIGAGKALRTIFLALVIPEHVPLARLPAAIGLQLVTSGIVFFAIGPVLGLIQDATQNYSITLHCLNILTYLVAISWIIESQWTKRRSAKSLVTNTNACAA